MDAALAGYVQLIDVVRIALFWAAALLGAVCLVDWTVRTRRISPFSPIARFCRRTVDPWMVPIERRVIRFGGQPAMAPWWMLAAVVIGGLLLLYVLRFIGGILVQGLSAWRDPATMPVLLIAWAFEVVEIALIVRVLSSWLPISPYSRWIRWSFVLSNWIVNPLRRIIPPMGRIDITPLVAYIALSWILEPAVLAMVRGMGAA